MWGEGEQRVVLERLRHRILGDPALHDQFGLGQPVQAVVAVGLRIAAAGGEGLRDQVADLVPVVTGIEDGAAVGADRARAEVVHAPSLLSIVALDDQRSAFAAKDDALRWDRTPSASMRAGRT